MKTTFGKVCVAVILLAILAFSLVQIPQAHATKSDVDAKLQSFLTNVLGIDLTEYTVTQNGYGDSYPLQYGGQIEQECPSYVFTTSNGSQLNVDPNFFYDGFLTACDLDPINGSILYLQQPSSSFLDQAESILQNYQTYADQNYAINTSYIQTALGMLGDIIELPSSYAAVLGNMQLTINQSSEFVTPADVTLTFAKIQFVYTENGIATPPKWINLDFQDGQLTSFGDYYGLYSVGPLPSISQDEAVSLGLVAAESYNVSLIGGTLDWSNYTFDASLGWTPGDSWMLDVYGPIPQMGYSASNITREPLILYPFWTVNYYWRQPIGDTVGMQVLLWGDTGQIMYCTPYGYLGTPSPSDSSTPSSSTPNPSSTTSSTPTPVPTIALLANSNAASPTSSPQPTISSTRQSIE